MAENHYVDSVDQYEAAEGVPDRSDLSTLYIDAKTEDLGPWMQEDDRQAVLLTERNKIQTGLRTSSVLIGLFISLPIVLGILIGQLAMVKTDLGDSLGLVFLLVLLGVGGLIMTFLLFKWIGARFHKHNQRALPITLITLGCLFFVIQKVFNLFNGLVGGLVGYAVALVALVVIGICIATLTIFVWTAPKVSGLVKLIVLLLILGGSAAIGFLA